MDASERKGIVAALVSSALGGSAGALTRYVIGAIDPVTLAAFRFGIAFLIVLPVALVLRSRWPQGKDWSGVAALGILFFCVFLSSTTLRSPIPARHAGRSRSPRFRSQPCWSVRCSASKRLLGARQRAF